MRGIQLRSFLLKKAKVMKIEKSIVLLKIPKHTVKISYMKFQDAYSILILCQ